MTENKNINQNHDQLWKTHFCDKAFFGALTVVDSPSVTSLVEETEGAAAAAHHTQHNEAQDDGSNHTQDCWQAVHYMKVRGRMENLPSVFGPAPLCNTMAWLVPRQNKSPSLFVFLQRTKGYRNFSYSMLCFREMPTY